MSYSFRIIFCAFVFAVFAPHAIAQSIPQYSENPYAQSKREREALEAWDSGALTSAIGLGDSNRTSYRILYHSLCGFGTVDPESGKFWRTLLMEDPSRIANNPKVSASLISEGHRAVWAGGVGFILGIKPENIVATCLNDAGSPGGAHGWNKDGPERQLLEYSKGSHLDIRCPDAVLAGSSGYNYNEIVLRGRGVQTGNPIQVEGVVIDCGTSSDMKQINQISDKAFEQILEEVYCKGLLLREEKQSLIKLRQQLPMFCF